jgi:hypothetical protein
MLDRLLPNREKRWEDALRHAAGNNDNYNRKTEARASYGQHTRRPKFLATSWLSPRETSIINANANAVRC